MLVLTSNALLLYSDNLPKLNPDFLSYTRCCLCQRTTTQRQMIELVQAQITFITKSCNRVSTHRELLCITIPKVDKLITNVALVQVL